MPKRLATQLTNLNRTSKGKFTGRIILDDPHLSTKLARAVESSYIQRHKAENEFYPEGNYRERYYDPDDDYGKSN